MTCRMYAPESSSELPTMYSACSYDQVAPSDSTSANSALIHSGSVSASVPSKSHNTAAGRCDAASRGRSMVGTGSVMAAPSSQS